MDKRTLLAIALSFLIIVAWQLLIVKPQQPATDETIVAEETTESTPEVIEEDVPPVEEEPEIVTPVKEPESTIVDSPERFIEVDTPLYTAVITTHGGTFVEFLLKDYTESIEDSIPVNIIHEEAEGLSPALSFDTNMGSFDEDVLYSASVDDDLIVVEGESEDDTASLVLTHVSDAFHITKTYTFNPSTYEVGVDFDIVNTSEHKVKGELEVSIFQYIDPQKKRGLFSKYTYPPTFVTLINDDLKKTPGSKLKPNEEETYTGDIRWFAYDTKYFIFAIASGALEDGEVEAARFSNDLASGSFLLDDLSISSGEEFEEEFTLYLGPKESHAMENVGYDFYRAIDYGFFKFLAVPLVMLLNIFFSFVKNYGVAIIFLTIVVRLLMFPITFKSMKSMKDMQKLQPLVTELREKYKDDKERMNQEVMKLYQTHKVNPVGGCLPLLLQLPVFIALYRALFVSIELRQSPFIFWIKDLSEMDPYYITPIVMGASYFLQQKLTPSSADPTQQKMMMMMPIMFTIIFLNLPSGLVLYFFVSNLLSIGQQLYMNKIKKD